MEDGAPVQSNAVVETNRMTYWVSGRLCGASRASTKNREHQSLARELDAKTCTT